MLVLGLTLERLDYTLRSTDCVNLWTEHLQPGSKHLQHGLDKVRFDWHPLQAELLGCRAWKRLLRTAPCPSHTFPVEFRDIRMSQRGQNLPWLKKALTLVRRQIRQFMKQFLDSNVHPAISLCSNACANRSSRRTTCTESDNTVADSSAVMPPKYRISMSCTFSGSVRASRSSASSMTSRDSSGCRPRSGISASCTSCNALRFSVALARARSTRICRISLEAIP